MTFREILEKVVLQTPGALAGAVMAADGIPVDEYELEEGSVDLSAVAVEFQRVLDQSRKVAGALYGESGGGLDELILITSGHQLLFRQLDDEFFESFGVEEGAGEACACRQRSAAGQARLRVHSGQDSAGGRRRARGKRSRQGADRRRQRFRRV